MTGGTLLAIEDLSAGYRGVPAVQGISLVVAAGELVVVRGANGAGKSTLLKAVIGLVPVLAGSLRLGGAEVTRMPTERRARLGIGLVPEGRRVFAGLSVEDNLLAASWVSAAARRRQLERVYALFPQLGGKRTESAWQLSGGQQQMLAIGRALAGEPRLLLLDEPTLGLSAGLAESVAVAVAKIVTEGTAVLAAEEPRAGSRLPAARTLWLDRGRLQSGPGTAPGHSNRAGGESIGK